MRRPLSSIILFVCLAAPASAQGILSTLYHLVRVEYLLEDQRALKFARPLDMSLPKYDFELIRAGIEGSASVRFRIDADGRVAQLTIAHQSQREFGEAAREAVAKWRFSPVSKDRSASSGEIECRFSFICHDPK